MLENMTSQMAEFFNQLLALTEFTKDEERKEVQFDLKVGATKRGKMRRRLDAMSAQFQRVPNLGVALTFTENKGFLSSTFRITFRGTVKMINALNKAFKEAQQA